MTAVDRRPSAVGQRRERPEPERRTVERRRIDGTVIDQVVLDPEIFGIVPNTAVLHQVVTAQLAAARAGTQSTRTRAEVAGGGAKPFRQKGTGRARQGSTRSPQWVGRWHRPRPQAPLLPPAHPQEDDPPGPVLGPVGPGRRGQGRPRRRVVVRRPRRPRTPWPPSPRSSSRAGCSSSSVPTTASPTAPSPTCPTSRPCRSAELNAYDVLRSDWVVFTDATAARRDRDGRRRRRPPARRAEPRPPRRPPRPPTTSPTHGRPPPTTPTPTTPAPTPRDRRRRGTGDAEADDEGSDAVRDAESGPAAARRVGEVLRPHGGRRLRLRGRPRRHQDRGPPAVEQVFGVRVTKRQHAQPQGQAPPQPQDQHRRQASRHQAGHRDARRRRPIDLFEKS